MSPWAWIRRACINGFPRVSGDEPPITSQEALDAMFSPRERG